MANYILENGEITEEPNIIKWGKWFEKADRIIEKSKIGDIEISTVFLGIDHSFGDGGLPVLFETMIFGGKHDQYQDRYTNAESAKIGHQNAVELVKSSSS